MRKDITGIILCGGRSSRMQTNKALLKLKDKTIIEIILDEMQQVFDKIVLNANECNEFSFLDISIVKDSIANRGPLAGIHASLKVSETDRCFITTCDYPLIKSNLIEYLVNINSDKEIIVPSINKIPEKLFGVYNRSVLIKIEEIFSETKKDKSVKGSVYDLHQKASVELVEISHLHLYNERMFLNMNTPEDYAFIKTIYEN
jgi:molybdopterin-guanine dinucleotide biosynthesis protein A